MNRPHNIIPWPTHTPVDVSAQLQASPWPPLGYEESQRNALTPIDLPDLHEQLAETERWNRIIAEVERDRLLQRVIGIASVALAILTLAYFGLEFVR